MELDKDSSVGIDDLFRRVVTNANHVAPTRLGTISFGSEKPATVFTPDDCATYSASGNFAALDISEEHIVVIGIQGGKRAFCHASAIIIMSGGYINIGNIESLPDVLSIYDLRSHPLRGDVTEEESVEKRAATNEVELLLGHNQSVGFFTSCAKCANCLKKEQRKIARAEVGSNKNPCGAVG